MEGRKVTACPDPTALVFSLTLQLSFMWGEGRRGAAEARRKKWRWRKTGPLFPEFSCSRG